MHDERRKGDERGKWSRLTGGCFGPVLVRFLSIRRPAAAERDLHTENAGGGGGGCGRMESQDDARESAVGEGKRSA